MLNRLPLALLHEGNERDGHIRQHEEREGEHVEHLLARGRVDGIPLDERGEHAEEEHEHDVVEQAEENLTRRFPREAAVARIEQIRSLRQDGLSIPAIKKLL